MWKDRGEKYKRFLNPIKKTDFRQFFKKYHPLYSDFSVDNMGNILVFGHLLTLEEDDYFLKYRPDGFFLGKFEIKTDFPLLGYSRIIIGKNEVLLYSGEQDEDMELQYKILRFKKITITKK